MLRRLFPAGPAKSIIRQVLRLEKRPPHRDTGFPVEDSPAGSAEISSSRKDCLINASYFAPRARDA